MAGIIKTVAEVRAHLKIDANFNVAGLPSFDGAVSAYLLPILGESLYTELETAYTNNTLSALQTQLLTKCHAVIVPFAFLAELPTRHVQMTDNGMQVAMSDEQRKPFRWEYKEVENQLYTAAYAAQELLIVFLKAYKEDFPLWAESPYNTEGFAIIRDGNELRKLVGIQQPHRCYMMLLGLFNTIAETFLKPNISEAYYDALTARILAGNTTTEDDYLLPKLRMAAARKTLALASMEMNVRFDSNGFTVVNKTIDATDAERTAADKKQLTTFTNSYNEMGKISMEQVITYLNKTASATKLTEYFDSDKYKDPTTTNFLDVDGDDFYMS